MFVTAALTREPPRASTHKSEEILLVVDDDPQVRKILVRFLFRNFDRVLGGSPSCQQNAVGQSELGQARRAFFINQRGFSGQRRTNSVDRDSAISIESRREESKAEKAKGTRPS